MRSLTTVVIALGANLGDRAYQLRRAIALLPVRVVKVSPFLETEPVDSPAGSGRFLNAVVIGYTDMKPQALLDALLALESRLGRVRRGRRNEPRTIDLDLILHGATRMRTRSLTLPHPRAQGREFVTTPLRAVWRAGSGPLPKLLQSAP
ncbi:MAG: 2-amino-4-hydroxy-6-hydroxymethyldihydropteridine diphosphokinase [Acidobacteriota bacterium]